MSPPDRQSPPGPAMVDSDRLEARCNDLERHIGLLIAENEQLHARERELEAQRDAISTSLDRAEELLREVAGNCGCTEHSENPCANCVRIDVFLLEGR